MPSLAFERRLARDGGVRWIAGLDEAGRGPLAGPVVAAAVMIDVSVRALPRALTARIDDSKQLEREEREAIAGELFAMARAGAIAIGIGAASAGEIDALNILQATFLAMRRARGRLPATLEAVLIDGNQIPPGLGCRAQAVIDGDAKCLTVAAASIVAKVVRDRAMSRLASRYDAFGWHSNVGYGTPFHLAALARCGPSPHHRLSFAPLRQPSLNL